MLKARLARPFAERRRAHGSRRSRAARQATEAARQRQPAEPLARSISLPASDRDLDVQRVRTAGGPLDRAYYTCSCGYLFTAEVSTSVSCPHCGATQAW